MKKILSLLVVICLTLSVAACSNTKTQNNQEASSAQTQTGKPVVALCLPTLDNPLMVQIKDSFNEAFGKDYQVEVASANNDATTQSIQIENFTTMKAKLIFISAIEVTSLIPSIEKARKNGTKVAIIGSDPGPNVADLVMTTNNFMAGEVCAKMAKEWIEKTYPNAADNSIEAALLVASRNPDDLSRSNGLKMISEPFCKNKEGAYVDINGNPISDNKGNYLSGKSDADRVPNPAYCPKVKIVTSVEAAMFADAQNAMDNILTQYPKVRVVICYSSDGANGASQTILDAIAKKTIKETPDKFATFGVGCFGPEEQCVKDSATNKSLLRGAVSFGGPDLAKNSVAYAKQLLDGASMEPYVWDKLATVTAQLKDNQGIAVYTSVQSEGILGINTK